MLHSGTSKRTSEGRALLEIAYGLGLEGFKGVSKGWASGFTVFRGGEGASDVTKEYTV